MKHIHELQNMKTPQSWKDALKESAAQGTVTKRRTHKKFPIMAAAILLLLIFISSTALAYVITGEPLFQQFSFEKPLPSLSMEEIYLKNARQLLLDAFGFDAEAHTPTITQCGDLYSLNYVLSPGDRYVVDFSDQLPFPMTLYHFHHANLEEEADIATDADFVFNQGLAAQAESFVERIYGVDCSEAEIHAYGYQNKVCVQLQTAPDHIFHVRFYYEDNTPTGVLFFDQIDTAQMAMDINDAKCFF